MTILILNLSQEKLSFEKTRIPNSVGTILLSRCQEETTCVIRKFQTYDFRYQPMSLTTTSVNLWTYVHSVLIIFPPTVSSPPFQ